MRLAFAVLLVLILLVGCGEKLHKQQSYVFGTLVEITLYGESEDKARHATNLVLKEFDSLHQTLHAWQPGALEQLNAQIAQASATQPIQARLTPELAAMLTDAQQLSARAEGLFNPAIGNLVRLWGFHSDTFESRLPDAAEIEKWVKAKPAMSDLRIEGVMLSSRNPAVRLDLGGYAKGYALDQAAATLRREGVGNALINIGGNIIALGKKGNQAWKVGIQHPRRAGALAMLALHDGEAIGTSGDYQRFFELDGKRYCHLIDPRSGRPADQTQAVTVIVQSEHAGTLSDVASKPLFIAGPADWRRLAGRMGISQAMLIAADGSIETLPGMAQRLQWNTDTK